MSGIVHDQSGRALPGVNVSVSTSGESHDVTTDEQGRYTIQSCSDVMFNATNLSAVKVNFSKPGYVSKEERVRLNGANVELREIGKNVETMMVQMAQTHHFLEKQHRMRA